MTYSYYYNQVPGQAPWRNNLIYTSLMNQEKTVFVQHYVVNQEYHQGQSQVVKPELMNEKWDREICYLYQMSREFPDLVPKILDIDLINKKIYLEVEGVDFWQRSLDANCSFDEVVPDWQEQMLDIMRAHRSLGLWKYSMHPSSYFVVGGRLKSINYFFTYHDTDERISIADVESHIYSTRQDELKKYIGGLGITWDQPQPFETLHHLCWESFRTNYPADFIERAKCIK